MRLETVVGVLPKTDHDLRLRQRVEDLLADALVLRRAGCRPPKGWTPSVIGGDGSRYGDGVAWQPGVMLLSVIGASAVT
jgi:hypothetical protein